MPEITETAEVGVNTDVLWKTKYGSIPGYNYGSSHVTHSPVTLTDLRALEHTVGWTAQDAEALKMAADVLSDQAEALVDSWRAQIGAQPHLAKWFVGPDGKPAVSCGDGCTRIQHSLSFRLPTTNQDLPFNAPRCP